MRVVFYFLISIKSFLMVIPYYWALCFRQVFKQPEATATGILELQGLFSQFEMTTKELVESKSQEEANDHIYSLVVFANHMLDLVVDNIILLNSREMPSKTQEQYVQASEIVLKSFQATFGLSQKQLVTGINNRLEIEMNEMMEKQRAHQERKAIGFGREESAIEFHSENNQMESIGFHQWEVRDKNFEGSSEKMAIGFGRAGEKEVEEITVEEDSQGFIGFVERDNSLHEETGEQRSQIGFIHYGERETKLNPESLDLIVFDTNEGVFNRIKNQEFND